MSHQIEPRHNAYLAATNRFASRVSAALVGLLVLTFSAASHALEPADLFRRPASVSGQTVDHQAWDRLLKTYVKAGDDGINRVDYAAFKRSGQAELKSYLGRLQTVVPGKLDKSEQFAFLVNLYNAKTIDVVLDHYPVRSIRDIALGGGLIAAFTGGPWKAKLLKLGGIDISLDDIEHGILRTLFKDPRVHYAVNCASLGCPNLRPEAFTSATLNAQLEDSARAFVNHPRGVSATAGKVVVSSIYHWFNTDFGGNDEGVLRHLRMYASPALEAKLKRIATIDDHAYDWSLNDARR